MNRNVILLFALSGVVAFADSAAEKAFKLLDRDGDGKIVPAEVQRSPWAERLDLDKSGDVSVSELSAGWNDHPALRAVLSKRFPQIMGFDEPKPSQASEPSPRQSVVELRPSDRGIGTRLPDCIFTALDGTEVKLSSFLDRKAVVIACISTSCPVGKRYIPTLVAIEKEYSAKGVGFIFLATTKTDTDSDLKATNLKGPIVRDSGGVWMKSLGVMSKTDTFVVDSRRTLKFRGAIDDQYGLGYSLDAPRNRFLAPAIEATLEGRNPKIAATDAPGCVIDLGDVADAKPGDITYHNTISRLLGNHCTECHRAGGVAPFALTSIEDVTEHAGMMRKMVSERLMPPWFAAPPKPGEHSPWANDRSLSEKERNQLLSWLASGRPVGDPADAPVAVAAEAQDWAIGKPDAIFQIPQPITVKATGTMPYQNVRVPTNFTETKWVGAVEVSPTVRDVVHHVLVFAESPGSLPRLRQAFQRASGDLRARDDDESGGFFAIYVPGNNTLTYPQGYAKALPAGSTLRFQIHYTPNGTEVKEQVRVGLKFVSAPEFVVENAGISTHRFAIPPGDPNYRVDAQLPVPRDAKILAFLPHMHLRGKAWRYSVRTPDGKEEILLDIPRYDFNWQLLYRYAEPRHIPAGSVIKTAAWYDNSAGNPANPDPGKTVKWGPQTTDEMMLGYVEYFFPKSR